jgi:hypothetical protein
MKNLILLALAALLLTPTAHAAPPLKAFVCINYDKSSVVVRTKCLKGERKMSVQSFEPQDPVCQNEIYTLATAPGDTAVKVVGLCSEGTFLVTWGWEVSPISLIVPREAKILTDAQGNAIGMSIIVQGEILSDIYGRNYTAKLILNCCG